MPNSHRPPPWENEWKTLRAATGSPQLGSRFVKLFPFIDKTPTPYRILWQRAFDKDPFLRTELRRWAKAGLIDRVVDADGVTELWSLPTGELGQERGPVRFDDSSCMGAAQGETLNREKLSRSKSTIMAEFDRPKLPGKPAARDKRLRRIMEPHVAPLTRFVQKLRRVFPGRDIPYFDPWDGGIRAKVLFLQEAPGPKSIFSGFVSRNNPDETAKNFFEISMEARLARNRTVRWNVVPWYIGTGKKFATRMPQLSLHMRQMDAFAFSVIAQPRSHHIDN